MCTELDPNNPTCHKEPGEGPVGGPPALRMEASARPDCLPVPAGRREPTCEEGEGQRQHRSHAISWSCRERRERGRSGQNRREQIRVRLDTAGQGCRQNGPAAEAPRRDGDHKEKQAGCPVSRPLNRGSRQRSSRAARHVLGSRHGRYRPGSQSPAASRPHGAGARPPPRDTGLQAGSGGGRAPGPQGGNRGRGVERERR